MRQNVGKWSPIIPFPWLAHFHVVRRVHAARLLSLVSYRFHACDIPGNVAYCFPGRTEHFRVTVAPTQDKAERGRVAHATGRNCISHHSIGLSLSFCREAPKIVCFKKKYFDIIWCWNLLKNVNFKIIFHSTSSSPRIVAEKYSCLVFGRLRVQLSASDVANVDRIF